MDPIERSIDPTALEWPSRGVARFVTADWNHSFQDLSGTRWPDVDQAIALEAEFLARLERAEGGGPEKPVAVHDEAFDEMGLWGLDLFDLGVAAATLALNASGCPTVTSCSGHGRRQPQIVFWVRPSDLPLILAAAEAADVGMVNADTGGVVIAYANSLEAMLLLARELRLRRTDARTPADRGSARRPRRDRARRSTS